MKNLLSIIALVAFAAVGASCQHTGRWSERIEGTGPVVKETRDASGFTKLTSAVSANVTVRQGSSFKVEIEGQKNVLDLLKTEVKDGALKIYFDRDVNVNYHKELNVYVTAPMYEEIKLSGSGNLKSENTLSGQTLKFTLSGSGNVNLPDVQYSAFSCKLSGSGDVEMGGKTNSAEYSISGSGNLDAKKVDAQTVVASISGSGDLNCRAAASLEAKVSGSGNIHYLGKPSVVSKVSGSGEISGN